MRNVTMMDMLRIAGFLVAFGTFLLLGLNFYDQMKNSQAAVIAQLSGIREEIGGVNTRLKRVEDVVFPILPRVTERR